MTSSDVNITYMTS